MPHSVTRGLSSRSNKMSKNQRIINESLPARANEGCTTSGAEHREAAFLSTLQALYVCYFGVWMEIPTYVRREERFLFNDFEDTPACVYFDRKGKRIVVEPCRDEPRFKNMHETVFQEELSVFRAISRQLATSAEATRAWERAAAEFQRFELRNHGESAAISYVRQFRELPSWASRSVVTYELSGDRLTIKLALVFAVFDEHQPSSDHVQSLGGAAAAECGHLADDITRTDGDIMDGAHCEDTKVPEPSTPPCEQEADQGEQDFQLAGEVSGRAGGTSQSIDSLFLEDTSFDFLHVAAADAAPYIPAATGGTAFFDVTDAEDELDDGGDPSYDLEWHEINPSGIPPLGEDVLAKEEWAPGSVVPPPTICVGNCFGALEDDEDDESDSAVRPRQAAPAPSASPGAAAKKKKKNKGRFRSPLLHRVHEQRDLPSAEGHDEKYYDSVGMRADAPPFDPGPMAAVAAAASTGLEGDLARVSLRADAPPFDPGLPAAVAAAASTGLRGDLTRVERKLDLLLHVLGVDEQQVQTYSDGGTAQPPGSTQEDSVAAESETAINTEIDTNKESSRGDAMRLAG